MALKKLLFEIESLVMPSNNITLNESRGISDSKLAYFIYEHEPYGADGRAWRREFIELIIDVSGCDVEDIDTGKIFKAIAEEESEEERWMDRDDPRCPECGQDWSGTL